MEDRFSNSDFMKQCQALQPVTDLIDSCRFTEAAALLKSYAPILQVPGLYYLLGCLQFTLGNEAQATESIVIDSAIIAAHKSRDLQALEEAKKKLGQHG